MTSITAARPYNKMKSLAYPLSLPDRASCPGTAVYAAVRKRGLPLAGVGRGLKRPLSAPHLAPSQKSVSLGPQPTNPSCLYDFPAGASHVRFGGIQL